MLVIPGRVFKPPISSTRVANEGIRGYKGLSSRLHHLPYIHPFTIQIPVVSPSAISNRLNDSPTCPLQMKGKVRKLPAKNDVWKRPEVRPRICTVPVLLLPSTIGYRNASHFAGPPSIPLVRPPELFLRIRDMFDNVVAVFPYFLFTVLVTNDAV